MVCEWMQPCILHVVYACECRLSIFPNAEHVNNNTIYMATATRVYCNDVSFCIVHVHTYHCGPNMNCVGSKSCMHVWYVQIFQKLMFKKTLQKMSLFFIPFLKHVFHLTLFNVPIVCCCLLVWQLSVQCFIIYNFRCVASSGFHWVSRFSGLFTVNGSTVHRNTTKYRTHKNTNSTQRTHTRGTYHLAFLCSPCLTCRIYHSPFTS